MSGGTVEQQGANNQNNQIWKVDSEDNGRVRFTTQDGTNRVIKVDNGTNNGEWLSLGGYTGDDKQKWTLQCNPADNTFWRVSRNTLTWDVKDFGQSSQLQLWGNTSEPFYDYRSYQFTGVSCPTGSTTPPVTPSGSLTLATVSYDCTSGVWQFQFTGGDGSSIQTSCPGAFGSRTVMANSVQSVILDGNLRDGTNFNITAVQSGQTFTFTFRSSCGGTTSPPVTPPTPGVLTITAPTYDCNTGDLTINTSGGNGSTIEYQISGLRGWGIGATMNVPSWQCNNNTSFTLQARQSSTEASPRTFVASCGGGRIASVTEETIRLTASPNPSRGQVRVRYWLAARQAGQLRVVSSTGSILSEQNVLGTGQTEEIILHLDKHPSGLYFINLGSGTVHETVKVLLQR